MSRRLALFSPLYRSSSFPLVQICCCCFCSCTRHSTRAVLCPLQRVFAKLLKTEFLISMELLHKRICSRIVIDYPLQEPLSVFMTLSAGQTATLAALKENASENEKDEKTRCPSMTMSCLIEAPFSFRAFLLAACCCKDLRFEALLGFALRLLATLMPIGLVLVWPVPLLVRHMQSAL